MARTLLAEVLPLMSCGTPFVAHALVDAAPEEASDGDANGAVVSTATDADGVVDEDGGMPCADRTANGKMHAYMRHEMAGIEILVDTLYGRYVRWLDRGEPSLGMPRFKASLVADFGMPLAASADGPVVRFARADANGTLHRFLVASW
jgi:hypothetical protein